MFLFIEIDATIGGFQGSMMKIPLVPWIACMVVLNSIWMISACHPDPPVVGVPSWSTSGGGGDHGVSLVCGSEGHAGNFGIYTDWSGVGGATLNWDLRRGSRIHRNTSCCRASTVGALSWWDVQFYGSSPSKLPQRLRGSTQKWSSRVFSLGG